MTTHPCQYVALRCTPRLDREECLNVGVILYSESADFLDAAHRMDAERLGAFAPRLDQRAVRDALDTVCAVCRGVTGGGCRTWARPGRSTVA